jgi:hypothetical protein
MKQDRLTRHLLVALVLSLAIYAAGYWFIESRRVAESPWMVSFQAGTNGCAEIIVRQESLGLGPVTICIETTNLPPETRREEWVFRTPRPVPFPVPLGQCVFQDATFLPGTVALEIAGVPIQMLPRALTVGTKEYSWSSNLCVLVPSSGLARQLDAPPGE